MQREPTMQNILQYICEIDNNRSKIWNDYWELHETFDKLKDETFNSVREEFDKNQKITKKFKKLKEIDDLTWELHDIALEGISLWINDDYLFTLDNKLCSTSHITRTKGAIIASNECSLCLETHDVRHLIKTSCGHYFGKKCFALLLKNKFFEDETIIRCPNCRNNAVTLQQFKYK
jgi:hypothetical protein